MDIMVPHFPMTIAMPPRIDEVFTDSAAESLVGSYVDFSGKTVKVKDAWVEDGNMMLKLVEIE